jgi:hypothetical protein
MSPEPRPSSQRFPSTHWSMIGRACDGREATRREALNQLLTRYWPALKAHLVVKKHIDSNEADDLVQGFIENKILERDLMAVADATRGRFRSLLATALDNYVASQMRMRGAAKREAERAVSLDQEAYEQMAVAAGPLHDVFDVAWAREVLAEILRQMQAECQGSGRMDVWGVFEGRVLTPILEGAEPLAYEQLLARFGFASPTEASSALVTAKRMFGRIMRRIVSEYATDEADVDAEIQELQEILSQGSPQL